MYDTTLSQEYIKGYGAMQKEKNKRCIPKEGMPHASACHKKREKMHTQRRYATCLGMSKKKRKKIALIQNEEKERWSIQRSSHTIHQKYPHTCTS